MSRGHEVAVDRLPDCDFCGDGTPAEYDTETKLGPWANACAAHWREWGRGDTGVGLGQRLIVNG